MAGTVHDTDPAGDVMLLVGPDKVSIRASSKVLRLASRVFDKMLGPHFAEGQSLSGEGSLEKSAASPTEFTLPDDDSEAMVLFCDTIHFKRHATPDIAFPLLAKMAFLSDKYDSSLALSSESEIWLSNFRGSKEGESCFGKMLWISYAMGNHRTFSKISREMIRECSHDELARQKHEMDCTSLPETIIESAEEIRASDFFNLCDDIASVLNQHTRSKCPVTAKHRNSGSVCFWLAKSGFFVEELDRIGLWPIPYTNKQKSIQEISSSLLGFENYSVQDTYEHKAYCDSAKVNFKHSLLQATTATSWRSRGLCLNCVKNGKIMIAEGNCRATSLELCKDFK